MDLLESKVVIKSVIQITLLLHFTLQWPENQLLKCELWKHSKSFHQLLLTNDKNWAVDNKSAVCTIFFTVNDRVSQSPLQFFSENRQRRRVEQLRGKWSGGSLFDKTYDTAHVTEFQHHISWWSTSLWNEKKKTLIKIVQLFKIWIASKSRLSHLWSAPRNK